MAARFSSYESIYKAATVNLDPSTLSKSNKTAKIVLKDLADIKKMKKGAKKNQKIEKLIFFIVQTLRRLECDHLIETTSIWVMINLIEVNAGFAKRVMMNSGVPGVLYSILNSHSLAGATRKYASDLCMYLASTEETHEQLSNIGSIDSLLDQPSMTSSDGASNAGGPPGMAGGTFGNQETASFVESILSSHSTVTRNSAPFVPYVVNDANAEALNRIFDERGSVNVSREQVFMSTVASQLPGPSGLDHLPSAQRENLRTPKRGTRGGIDEEESVDESDLDSSQASMESMFGKNSMFNSRPQIDDLGAGYSTTKVMQRQMKENTLFKLQNQTLRENRNRDSAKELHRERSKFQSPGGDLGNMRKMMGSMGGGMSVSFSVGDINSHNKGDTETVGSQTTYLESVKASSAHRNNDNFFGLNSPDPDTSPMRRNMMSPLSMGSPQKAPGMMAQYNHIVPANATDFLFDLDPLGMDDTYDKLPAPKLVSEVNDDEESLLSISMSEQDEDEDDFDEQPPTDEPGSPKRPPKKLRIRAEKLLDQRFIQGLFTKKMSIKHTQVFLAKLQDLLELVDTDKSGYVPWGSFGRVLVNVAPAHVLREDVEDFLDAQVESNEDIINYREFVISGKVTIVEKKNGRSVLPINGWLERQKLYSGDASTWTWKNHLKWYNARKRDAVVWLMRRSTRAQVQEVVLGKAKLFLYNEGKRAKAVSFLLHCGHQSRNALAVRKNAKKHLMFRAFQARMLRNRVSDAYQFLSVLAEKVKFAEEVAAKKNQVIKIEDVLTEHAPQVGYEILYETRNKHIAASMFLIKRSKRALDHSARQDEEQAELAANAKRVLTQMIFVARAAQWLFEKAQFYHNYCCEQDNTLLYLKRKGKWALAYFDRQAAALPWLIGRGRAALAHNKLQEDTFSDIIRIGQFKLNLLNKREEAVAYTRRRRYNAEALIINQKAAIQFLRSKISLLDSNVQAVLDDENWLYKRGQASVVHVDVQRKAVRRLQYQGGRARVVHRRLVTAFVDLHQTGQVAKITNFNQLWPKLGAQGANLDRLKDEIRRMKKKNHEVTSTRDADESLIGIENKEARWKVELKDAYDLLTKNTFMPGESVNDKKNVLDIEREPKISRINMLRLLKNGELLKMTSEEVNKAWREMDPQGVGFLSFHDIWDWFEVHAFEVHRQIFLKSNGKKYFTFRCVDIIPLHEQALFIFKKRFAIQEQRMVSGEESDDEEQSDEDSDEESDEESEEGSEEGPVELDEWDKAFEKLIEEHKPALLRTFETGGNHAPVEEEEGKKENKKKKPKK
jgi:hypothetical protein